jgi:uncharacterized RDD family membrane protein YckC
MSQNGYQDEKGPAPEMESNRQWQRFLAIIYRLVIILGIVLLAVVIILVVITTFVPYWSIAFPLVLILVGVILARLEYTLHNKLSSKDQS